VEGNKMIWFRKDGTYIHNGFNFFYPNDPESIGFIFRLGKFKVRVRWSKNVKRWFLFWGIEK
jgi:hypothetical protein